MPLVYETCAARLVVLSRERFAEDLGPAEMRILRQSALPEVPRLSGFPDRGFESAEENATSAAEAALEPGGARRPAAGWQGPTCRSGLLRWLINDPEACALIEPRGLRVSNVRFDSPLDLAGCRVPVPLEFSDCLFEASLLLNSSDLTGLSLRNCTLLEGLLAQSVKVHGPLYLESIASSGTLNLDNATIEGEVRMRDSFLLDAGGSLSLDGAKCATDLILKPHLECAGNLYMPGIQVEGFIDMSGIKLTAPNRAIDLHDATIRRSIYLEGLEAAGRVSMSGAKIGGQLVLNSAKLTACEDALLLDNCDVGGGIFLKEGFVCSGTIRMLGAKIIGGLDCKGAHLTSRDCALSVNNATIHGNVHLNNGFEATSEIRMFGAEIHGNLDCCGAKLNGSNSVFLLNGAKITGDVFFSNGFSAAGEIRMLGTQIEGGLLCDDASIGNLYSVNMNLGRDFYWSNIRNASQSVLGLQGATMRSLRDDKASWPAKGNLQVNGLSLQDLRLHDPQSEQDRQQHRAGKEQPFSVFDRIEWLNLQQDRDLTEPQPWMQLAKLLEDRGHKRDARRVIFELQRHRATVQWRTRRLARALAILFARLEEQPLRILISIAFCVSLGAAFFRPMQAHFAPTSEAAYTAVAKSGGSPMAPPLAYPKFQPIVYSLENVLPLVKLGQDDHWGPDAHSSSFSLYWSLMLMRLFLILAGWAQGVVLAAAVSSRFKN